MSRLIDADKLLKHLKDELEACEESPPDGDATYMRGVYHGTRLGLKSAISFVQTLIDIQAIHEAGQPGTNRGWLKNLSDDELAEFLTHGLMCVPVCLPGVTYPISIRNISTRYTQSTPGVKQWLSTNQEFMTINEWRERPFSEVIKT